jgi:hypothetical protein
MVRNKARESNNMISAEKSAGRGFNSHSRLQFFLTLLPFNQFTFPFSVRAENSETLGNTKPATFATARFCDSGIVLLSSVFVARLAGQIFYIPDFTLRRFLPGVD